MALMPGFCQSSCEHDAAHDEWMRQISLHTMSLTYLPNLFWSLLRRPMPDPAITSLTLTSGRSGITYSAFHQ